MQGLVHYDYFFSLRRELRDSVDHLHWLFGIVVAWNIALTLAINRVRGTSSSGGHERVMGKDADKSYGGCPVIESGDRTNLTPAGESGPLNDPSVDALFAQEGPTGHADIDFVREILKDAK